MKITAIARFSFFFLLSTASAALAQSTSGAVGTSGTSPTRAAVPPPAARPAAATTAPDYKLVTGDKLRIEVYKDAQLSQNLQIRPDGKITLPLLGDIPAAGRTSNELTTAITEGLKEFYERAPVVTVIVTETVPANIYVMGEVHTPGPQPLKGPTSIMQALATAGGFTEWANTKDIQILRQTSTGQTTLRFNYKDAVNGKSKTIMLQPNDTVIVK